MKRLKAGVLAALIVGAVVWTAVIPGISVATVNEVSAASRYTGATTAGDVKDVTSYASFETAISTIGSSATTTLIIPICKTVSANTTVTTNITLWFVGSGCLSVNVSITATLNGPIVADRRQIFAGAGTIIGSSNKVQAAWMAEWWGFKGDDATANDTAMTAVLASFPATSAGVSIDLPTVTFAKATYRFRSAVTINQVIRLKGAGFIQRAADSFGHANWLTSWGLQGTVLKWTANTNGINLDSTAAGAVLEDLALLGSGGGTTKGIYADATGAGGGWTWRNVGVFNFQTGYHALRVDHSTYYHMRFGGNTTSLNVDNTNQMNFHGLFITGTGTGIDISGSVQNTFYGTTIYGATTRLVKLGTNAQDNIFDGLYTEQSGVLAKSVWINGGFRNKLRKLHLNVQVGSPGTDQIYIDGNGNEVTDVIIAGGITVDNAYANRLEANSTGVATTYLNGAKVKTLELDAQVGGNNPATYRGAYFRSAYGEGSAQMLGMHAGTIFADGNNHTTSGTSEQSLVSVTIKGGVIRAGSSRHGDTLFVRARGDTAGNGNKKTLKLKWGTTELVNQTTAANAMAWRLDCEIYASGLGNYYSYVLIVGTAILATGQGSFSASFANDQILDLRAVTASGAGDITARFINVSMAPYAGN